MTVDLNRVFPTLDDMEQIQVELEAEERGVSINTVLVELFREGLAAEVMDGVFQPRDRQWKSH